MKKTIYIVQTRVDDDYTGAFTKPALAAQYISNILMDFGNYTDADEILAEMEQREKENKVYIYNALVYGDETITCHKSTLDNTEF